MGEVLSRITAILSALLMLHTSAALATETVTYGYDSLGRLITISSSGTVNNGQTVSTTFDSADNRANYSVSGALTATISIGAATVTEGGTLSFTVTRSGVTTNAVSASYATASGTAVSPGDFTAKTGTVSFASGVTSQTVTVTTIDDTAGESAETMTVTLSSPSGGAAIGTATGTGTINDNDFATISIGAATVTEGGTLSFTVTRSGVTTNAVSASYATASGTAVSPGDFTAKTGTVSFAAGVTSQTVTVTTIDDTTGESAETMTVTLSSPSVGAAIGTATGTGTINDNDFATISIGNASVTEGGTLTFTVTRSGVTTSAVSATYATASGTAASPGDFTAKTGTVSFAAGVTSQAVTVTTIDDTAVESAETMTVTLSSPSAGAAIGTATGTGTINDNDTAGTVISIADAAPVTEGIAAVFTITRTGNTSSTSSINYQVVGGTATLISDVSGSSGSRTFSAGQTSRTVSITTVDDTVVEGTENFTVVISNPVGATLGNATAAGTINDND